MNAMSKTFRTTGTGSQQALHDIEDNKVPIYDTKADAEADLANLAEGQIIGTKDVSTDYESELYNYVDAKLQTTTAEIAMDVFLTGSKAYLNKSGNNVQLRYWAEGDSTTYNPITRDTNVLIGTIPAGFRPKQKIVLNSDNNVPNDPNNASTLVTIETSGGIYIWVFGQNIIPANFSINVDYNVDGSNNNFMSVNTLKDAKDYTDARAVRKYDYTMTGTDNVYNDIKALCNQLLSMGENTYAGEFFRTGKTGGHYSISVKITANTFIDGTVVVDNSAGRSNIYAVSRVNNDWHIMPTMLDNNIHATDCNLVINPGIYNIDNSTANVPYSGCYGILESKGFNPDVPSDGAQWIYQEVIDTSGRRFVRRCINPNTLSPTSAQWSTWQEEDVFSHDIVVTGIAGINGYLSQLKYFLSQADWSKIDASEGYRREFVGSMELTSYWYGTYHLSNMGSGYKMINGAIYAEGQPIRFTGWFDPNHPTGWRVTPSYNYTYVDISGQQYINDLNQQLSTALNLLAPQTWEVQHCDCNIEVLGYFYAMGSYDRRGTYASFSGTILSSNSNANGQTFTAEFEVTRNYWVCHNIILTYSGSNIVDGNSNIYLGGIMGTNDSEIIYVRCTSADVPVIPAKNSSNQWYARVSNWDGTSCAGSTLTLEIKFRIL